MEEIVARADASAAAAPDALQCFHALKFPANHGSKVMKYLGSHFGALSALGFGHLKRMKKAAASAADAGLKAPPNLVAIVAPADGDGSTLPASIEDRRQEMEALFDGRLTLVEALKLPPRTRELWEAHTTRWPLVFHASVLPEALAPPPVTEEEQRRMERHARSAIACGRAFAAGAALGTFPCASGCVIVDPEADEQVAASEEGGKSRFLPIWHPVMVAIDAVAARDRQKELEARSSGRASAPKRPRRAQSDAASASLGADVDAGEQRVGSASDERESYLCTGYDVFVDREPCAMCAMALVHSRARRVVFGARNEADGVLAGAVRLHTLKSLNHHYRVFRLDAATSSA